MENNKPTPVLVKELIEEVKELKEIVGKLFYIITPPPTPTEVKTPEELKIEIEKMVDDAFEKAKNPIEGEVLK